VVRIEFVIAAPVVFKYSIQASLKATVKELAVFETTKLLRLTFEDPCVTVVVADLHRRRLDTWGMQTKDSIAESTAEKVLIGWCRVNHTDVSVDSTVVTETPDNRIVPIVRQSFDTIDKHKTILVGYSRLLLKQGPGIPNRAWRGGDCGWSKEGMGPSVFQTVILSSYPALLLYA
jgi:hypothetical protein